MTLSSSTFGDLAPHDFLQLAGHPLRWALLGELAKSDRMVHELTGLVGEPQNLVSYHLGKLRDGRLVSTRRSSADRRDAYYAMDLARFGGLMSKTGSALHPGLKLDPAPLDPAAIPKAKVLFLCTGNSARSQMAEALIRVRSAGAVEAFSAGSHPKPLHPNACRVMLEDYGVDISGQAPKLLDLYVRESFDRVISLCDKVREACPAFSGHPQMAHWSIPNPATGAPDDETYPLFRDVAAELDVRIGFLLAGLSNPS